MADLRRFEKRLEALGYTKGLIINTNHLDEASCWAMMRARQASDEGDANADQLMEDAVKILEEIHTQPQDTPNIKKAAVDFEEWRKKNLEKHRKEKLDE